MPFAHQPAAPPTLPPKCHVLRNDAHEPVFYFFNKSATNNVGRPSTFARATTILLGAWGNICIYVNECVSLSLLIMHFRSCRRHPRRAARTQKGSYSVSASEPNKAKE